MPIVHNVPVVELYLQNTYLGNDNDKYMHLNQQPILWNLDFLDVWTVDGVLIILDCIDCILVDSPM